MAVGLTGSQRQKIYSRISNRQGRSAHINRIFLFNPAPGLAGRSVLLADCRGSVFQPAGRGRNALARRSLIWGPAVIPLPPRARPAGVAISSNAGRGLSFCEDGRSAGEPAPAWFVSRGKSRLASEVPHRAVW